MPMRRYVQDFGVTRVDDDVIDEQLGPIEICQQPPIAGTVGGRINLAIQRPEIKAIRIVWINHERADVTSGGSGSAPVGRISA